MNLLILCWNQTDTVFVSVGCRQEVLVNHGDTEVTEDHGDVGVFSPCKSVTSVSPWLFFKSGFAAYNSLQSLITPSTKALQ